MRPLSNGAPTGFVFPACFDVHDAAHGNAPGHHPGTAGKTLVGLMGRPSRKEELVERTFGVWLDRGVAGASVNDLVAAAGVPKGSFYNHFSSKEKFAVAHVQRYVRALEMESLITAEGPALQVMRQHFDRQVVARRATDLGPGCLLGTFSTGVSGTYAELRSAVRGGFDQWIDALAQVISRGRDNGEIATSVDPSAVAAALVDGFQGALARARVSGESRPLEVFLSTTMDTLCR
jgi:TetR/AcrR family transcriptional regulator, transcriptional repressor for nem operon